MPGTGQRLETGRDTGIGAGVLLGIRFFFL